LKYYYSTTSGVPYPRVPNLRPRTQHSPCHLQLTDKNDNPLPDSAFYFSRLATPSWASALAGVAAGASSAEDRQAAACGVPIQAPFAAKCAASILAKVGRHQCIRHRARRLVQNRFFGTSDKLLVRWPYIGGGHHHSIGGCEFMGTQPPSRQCRPPTLTREGCFKVIVCPCHSAPTQSFLRRSSSSMNNGESVIAYTFNSALRPGPLNRFSLCLCAVRR